MFRISKCASIPFCRTRDNFVALVSHYKTFDTSGDNNELTRNNGKRKPYFLSNDALTTFKKCIPTSTSTLSGKRHNEAKLRKLLQEVGPPIEKKHDDYMRKMPTPAEKYAEQPEKMQTVTTRPRLKSRLLKTSPSNAPPSEVAQFINEETKKEKENAAELTVSWQPMKRISREMMAEMRFLHKAQPELHTIAFLGRMFGISGKAVVRILKSKWEPSIEESTEKSGSTSVISHHAHEQSLQSCKVSKDGFDKKEYKLSNIEENEVPPKIGGHASHQLRLWSRSRSSLIKPGTAM